MAPAILVLAIPPSYTSQDTLGSAIRSPWLTLLLLSAAACGPSRSGEGLAIPLAGDKGFQLTDKALVYDVDLRRETLPDGWRVETGTWSPTMEGLVGSISENRAAVVWCHASFPHDVAIRVEAEPLEGHTNDANAFFRAAGTIYDKGERGAWIVGIAGWYVHDDGLEKHPGGPTWRVKGVPLQEGNIVEFVAGILRGKVFLWKGGRLLLEREDPTPHDARTHGRVGLGTWNSKIRFRRLRVYRVD